MHKPQTRFRSHWRQCHHRHLLWACRWFCLHLPLWWWWRKQWKLQMCRFCNLLRGNFLRLSLRTLRASVLTIALGWVLVPKILRFFTLSWDTKFLLRLIVYTKLLCLYTLYYEAGTRFCLGISDVGMMVHDSAWVGVWFYACCLVDVDKFWRSLWESRMFYILHLYIVFMENTPESDDFIKYSQIAKKWLKSINTPSERCFCFQLLTSRFCISIYRSHLQIEACFIPEVYIFKVRNCILRMRH